VNSEDISRSLSPPAERNKQPILNVLHRHLLPTGKVLEIASGTGQHVVYFASAFPKVQWQPSDPDVASRQSISAWIRHERLSNVLEPLQLDVCRSPWPVDAVDAILCINMIHISPWEATPALIEGAAALLAAGGLLFLYGPYRRVGHPTAAGNEAFDASLRARNPAWGLRDLGAVQSLAEAAGFVLVEVAEMPANNLSVVLRRCEVSQSAAG